MLQTVIDELDGGSLYSVQVQSDTDVEVNLVVSTVKTVQTLNQSEYCRQLGYRTYYMHDIMYLCTTHTMFK